MYIYSEQRLTFGAAWFPSLFEVNAAADFFKEAAELSYSIISAKHLQVRYCGYF